MQIQQKVLRVAAAAGVTLFLTGGALGPAYATDDTSGDTASTHQSHSTKSGRADHSNGNASTTGDSSSPQPESTADQNDGGANAGDCDQSTSATTTSDPAGSTQSTDDTQTAGSTDSTTSNNYCSTRDGTASGNGNGNGEATGKPCAGCVGKADNKNPRGQYPDGTDGNNGYECDGNNGIAKTNPAHTGCTSATVAGEDAGLGETCPSEAAAPQETSSDEANADEQSSGDETAGHDMATEDCTPPVTCPEGSDMTDENCVAPVADTPGSGGQVLGSEAGANAGTANRAPAEASPASSGLLPETGAGRYGIPIAAGLLLLSAGGALLLRRRSHADG